MNRRKIALYIFLASTALFLAGLQSMEFTKINCRFALFVHEMAEGAVGPFPFLYGEPYYDYPSVHTYLMYLGSLLGGGVSMLTITLPSAIMAGAVASLTYLIGERMSNKFGLFAVLMLVTNYEFLCIARAPSPDMFVTFSAVCAFYLMYTSELDNKAVRLFLLPVLFVLGFAMRGPIGAVIPIGVVVTYYFTARRWKTAIAGGVLGALVLACCLMLYIIIIHKYGGIELVRHFKKAQVDSRILDGKPIWFYFTNAMASYVLAYPLGFLVMGTYAWIERKNYFKEVPADTYAALRQRLTGYFFVIVLGMTVPGTKHLRYIAPAIPAIALLAAFLFVNPDNLNLFKRVREIFLRICFFVPFAALLVLVTGKIVLKILAIDIPIPFFLPAIMFVILGFAIISGTRRVRYNDKVIFIVALTAMTFFVIKVMIIEPVEIYLESSYGFVKKIEEKRPVDKKLCFCGIGRDSEALKYLVNLKRDKYYIPDFIELDENEKLLELPAGTLIIFKANKTKHIKPEVKERLEEVLKGKLGHKECTVFRLKKK